MAVPFRKISKTRRDMRRTHYKITANGLVECSNCGAKIRPHRACPKCWTYTPRRAGTGCPAHRCHPGNRLPAAAQWHFLQGPPSRAGGGTDRRCFGSSDPGAHKCLRDPEARDIH